MTEDGSVENRRGLVPKLAPVRLPRADEGSPMSAVLIHGSAIKSHRKPWRFNYLQFSNRR